MAAKRSALILVSLGLVLSVFALTPTDAALPPVTAKSAFLDGFVANDRGLPSTSSVTDPAASLAKLTVGRGSYVVFASVAIAPHIGADNTQFHQWLGLLTCVVTPPHGPHAKAEFQFVGGDTTHGPAVQTLSTTTTTRGPGVIDFSCTDGTGLTDKPSATYRFLQLTALRVQGLRQINLNS